MANLITLIRLLTVFVIVAIILYASPTWQLLSAPLIIIIILLDGLDGIVARMREETTVFGSVFDIAADRVVEMTLWILLAYLDIIDIWITFVFLTRGILVDSLRKPLADQGTPPFGIMKTSLGSFLVASRTMRFFSGLFKLLTFVWLFFLFPANELWPQIFVDHEMTFGLISNSLLYITLAISLARGIPVLIETIPACSKRN